MSSLNSEKKSPRGMRRGWIGGVSFAAATLWLGGSADSLGGFADSGWLAFAAALAPASLLFAGAIGAWMLAEDLRAPRLGALGALLGTLLALPAFAWLPWPLAATLFVLSALAFVSVGRGVLDAEPLGETGAPAPLGVRAALGAAIDETLLAGQPRVEPPLAPELRAACVVEVREALALFEARGWSGDPRSYHTDPPALSQVELEPARAGRVRYERLAFASGYEPDAAEPGRERWLGYEANRTAHARVLRHAGDERPWLLAIHGSRQGGDADLRAFGMMHRAFGYNVVMPVLPLHGVRAHTRRSGDGFVGRYELDFVHAAAQSVWDLRRLIGWMRSQPGGGSVGIYGVSLGGYVGALVSSIESGLDRVILGVPASDFAALERRSASPVRHANAGGRDLAWSEVESLYRVVSPLAVEPRLEREKLCLFAATADRFLPREHVERLWKHWGEPRLVWSPGGHITGLLNAASREVLRDFLTADAETADRAKAPGSLAG